jgi:hypothetical protein
MYTNRESIFWWIKLARRANIIHKKLTHRHSSIWVINRKNNTHIQWLNRKRREVAHLLVE